MAGAGPAPLIPDNSTLEQSGATIREKDAGTTNAKLANMAQATVKGRAAGAGTGVPQDLTAAQVNTILGDILADGSVAFAADQSMGGHKLTSLANAVALTDGVNLQTLQSYIEGLDAKQQCAYCSTTALAANTYNNGTAGVGATLTGNANGPLVVDGVTFLVATYTGLRVLVAGEATPANNGWYTVTQVGVVAVSKYILTRATDSDQAAEIGPGYLTAIEAPTALTPGAANNGLVFISLAPSPFTVGADSLIFSRVGGAYSADETTLHLAGSTFSINLANANTWTAAQTINAALTQSTGAVSLHANAASDFTTSSGVLTLSGFAGINLQDNGTTLLDVGVSSSTQVTLAANVSLGGSAGTGALAFGSMTGTTILPTGNFTWIGASTKSFSVSASGVGSAVNLDAVTIHVGATTATTTIAIGNVSSTTTVLGTLIAIDSTGVLDLGVSTATSVVVGNASSTTDLKGDLITTGIWTGQMYGFPLTYASATTLTVGYANKNARASTCRSQADTDFLTLAGGTTYALDITSTGTSGVALGNDRFVGTGTVTVNNSATISSGSTPNAWSTDFKTRACTGTFNTVTTSTTVTATGSKFLTEFAVNDLIGAPSYAHSSVLVRVTAIASDISMTVSQTVSFTSGDSIICVEQPVLSITGDGASPHQVDKISADTGASSLLLTEATTGGVLTNAAIQIGGRTPARAAASAAMYLYVWLGKGSSGQTAYVSTQRTTPFGVANYNASIRRIGALLMDASANIVEFEQYDLGGGARLMLYVLGRGAAPSRLLSGGTATTWTNITNGNTIIPPVSTLAYVHLETDGSATTFNVFSVDSRGKGTGRVGSNIGVTAFTNAIAAGTMYVPADGAQCFEYINSATAASSFFDVAGYVDVL